MIRNHLGTFWYNNRKRIQILKDFPYTHAIPIKLDFGDQVLFIDCIPAIAYQDNQLVVPNGMNYTKLVDPNLEVEALSELNTIHDGKATKLILLLKYWNIQWKKPLKSYVIERLVDHIFIDRGINAWEKGVKTFFSNAVNILRDNIYIPDRLYENYSILDDYDENTLDYFLEAFQKANKYAIAENWNKLFGNF